MPYHSEPNEQFPSLFKGLGKLEESYEIELQEDARPYAVSTPRRVPIPLMPAVKEELSRMEEQGVITRVNEPTDWCVGMVVVCLIILLDSDSTSKPTTSHWSHCSVQTNVYSN